MSAPLSWKTKMRVDNFPLHVACRKVPVWAQRSLPFTQMTAREESHRITNKLSYSPTIQPVQKKTLSVVNAFLEELSKWAYKWRVTLAPHKCVYIAFATRSPDKFDISLNGIQIRTDSEVNFLGLRLDNHLTFCNHVNHLRLWCYKRIDIIRVISSKRWHLLPKTSLETSSVMKIVKIELIEKNKIQKQCIKKIQIKFFCFLIIAWVKKFEITIDNCTRNLRSD